MMRRHKAILLAFAAAVGSLAGWALWVAGWPEWAAQMAAGAVFLALVLGVSAGA